MKKLIVPCDFSKPAINAFRFALDLAVQAKGTIELLHVIELPVVPDGIVMPVLNFEETYLTELKEKSEQRLDTLISKYNVSGIKINTTVLFGAVTSMILSYIKDSKADVVVMGSHGASGLREMFIGSNAEKIVRKSTLPVVVIKNYYKGPIKNIVFPNVLTSEHQEELIERVKALQSFFKAVIHLVRINTPLNFQSDTVTRKQLEAFVKEYKLKDYTVNIFNAHSEEAGILQFSKAINADLIAMGTKGHSGLSHMLLGSSTEDIVNHGDKLIWTWSMHNNLVEA
jgi:nucleotide-binding universal stress UspA family protein